MLRPDVDEYLYGWICALSVEYIFAEKLLDDEFESPPQLQSLYKCGRMGGHNVVITWLPKGVYGQASATSAALEMMSDFPSIRYGLMVGIGGGAPSEKHDIRLGDVVVSAPNEAHAGVWHYDSGKLIQGQKFESTGNLNKPPSLLLKALTKLESMHTIGHQINQTVNNVILNDLHLKIPYQKPPSETDVLYKSSFLHPDGKKRCQTTCQGGPIIDRPDRDLSINSPRIWYGLIASADKVMKDATRRDELARDKDVLAFEMEAAGLMDRFPCVVIRGICDYADSHKNETWQGYAAATAAAYAKELLATLPSRPGQKYQNDRASPGPSRRSPPRTTSDNDLSWSASISRQPTCSDQDQGAAHPASQVRIDIPATLKQESSSQRTPEQVWVNCVCARNCGLKWNLADADQPPRFQRTFAAGDSEQCDIKRFVDNYSRSPLGRFSHGPLVGVKGKPLWKRMMIEWQRANMNNT